MENSLKEFIRFVYVSRRDTLRPLTKMQRLSKAHPVYPLIGPFKSEYIVTDIDNEKIIPPLKLMTKSEVMNDLFKLSDIVQKHTDKRGCQHCLDLLESVYDDEK